MPGCNKRCRYLKPHKMQTWEINIKGLVQGVGFRPFIYKQAAKRNIKGFVSNTNEGVCIQINASKELAEAFYQYLVGHAPVNAFITSHSMRLIEPEYFTTFVIHDSIHSGKPDLMLPPDIAICPSCLSEIFNEQDRRYGYPFTTCLNCGPRYSIITGLPYDRAQTTMADLVTCTSCSQEYIDINGPRHHSQTNSCPECTIPMKWYNNQGEELSNDTTAIIQDLKKVLLEGSIVAVKGVGGYLLVCDAANEIAIALLRKRKHRPEKPFALLYPSIESAEQDVFLTDHEIAALKSPVAPVVLCRLKEQSRSGISTELVAHGLNRIGVMLPYTALLALVSLSINIPLVATSGNLSGAPIIYQDEEALIYLTQYADYVLTFERAIVVPQDDSVMQFTLTGQKILIRRSRGLAPSYFINPFNFTDGILATGAELKSAFALEVGDNLYISQFLGDQSDYSAHLSYKNTLRHLNELLQFTPQLILVDKHPNYTVSNFGKELADQMNISIIEVQHHEAHFAAVLAENNLMQSDEPVMGVIWDGAGYGDDHQIWGGEFFVFESGFMDRVAHLDYFAWLQGDKMSLEPRMSALSLLCNQKVYFKEALQPFNIQERMFMEKLVAQPSQLLTSSMGRLLDGIASMLGILHFNSFEGEAAMKLQAMAERSEDKSFQFYVIPKFGSRLQWNFMVQELVQEKLDGIPVSRIAYKVFVSLAQCIRQSAKEFGVQKIAFSGGVFQNALLVDLIIQLMGHDYLLFFHKQLSCNDECISFGQLARYSIGNNILVEKASIHYQN
jgi:hydrogenase maturation protein HypF